MKDLEALQYKEEEINKKEKFNEEVNFIIWLILKVIYLEFKI